jgi:hypothetical protein
MSISPWTVKGFGDIHYRGYTVYTQKTTEHIVLDILQQSPKDTVTDRILEMKKGSRAAGIGKGSGPKPRQKISDITDFQKKEFWK